MDDTSLLMRRYGIRRIERHDPTDELPYEWFAVELDDSRMIGTDRTFKEALGKADDLRDQFSRKAA